MIEVTCAIIRNDEGKVLVVRRGPQMGNAGKWEFPGGKLKSGETYEDCIVREIHEELGIDIVLTGSLEPVEHYYGDKFIKLYPFICDTLASKLFLAEHDAHKWLVPGKLLDVKFSAADVPVAKNYVSLYPDFIEEQVEEAGQNIRGEAGDELAGVLSRITTTHEINMIARQAAYDSLLLNQLVLLSTSADKRVGFKASWPLSKVVDINREATIPHLCSLIDSLPSIKNESVQRAFMRVIVKSDMNAIEVSHHGKLVEYCFQQLRTKSTAIAPRAYSMEILGKMCDIYPEMKGEVVSTINIVAAESSAGIKAQARKVISRLLNT